MIQPQTIQLCVTVVFRQLNGKRGAIDVLDAVRRILGGYTPTELPPSYLADPGGLYRRGQGTVAVRSRFATESVFIEDSDLPSGRC